MIVTGVIVLAILVLFLVIDLRSNDGSMVLEFLFKFSEKKMQIGKFRQIDSESKFIEFSLPSERRSWPIYTKSKIPSWASEKEIELIVVNHSHSEMVIKIREVEEDVVQESKLKKGEEYLLFSGNLKTLIFELTKENRIRENEDTDYFSEWSPLVMFTTGGGAKLKGGLKIVSEKAINLEDPIVLYTHIGKDTL